MEETRTLQELSQGVYFVPGVTNVGVITSENNGITELYLVDSGNSEMESESLLEIIEKYFSERNINYKIKTILTTHGHPDHFGGHKFIKDATGCEVCVNPEEEYSLLSPIIHSSILWGGYPPHELQTLYFFPEACAVDKLTSPGDIIKLSGNREISFIDIRGHSYASMGIVVTNQQGEKVIFTGDSIFERSALGRFWIPFIVNPEEFYKSLEKIENLENVLYCVPSHGAILKDNIAETAELNKIAILSTKKCILDALNQKEYSTVEEITKYVADKNEYKMSLGQYVLMNSTIKSYLSVLHENKLVKFELINNALYFRKH